LTVLSGFVETLQSIPLQEEERQRYLQMMGVQAERMQTLVADLLTLSQLEGSVLPALYEKVALPELMSRVAADARALSAVLSEQQEDDRGPVHDLIFEPAPPWSLSGVRSELLSAMSNLVSNAIRYTPPGGVICAGWSRSAEGVVFSVTDTGPGIAPDDQARLFHAFEQTATGANAGGAGLGLAISRQLAERMGGTLSVRSAPGAGSAFTVVLPLPDSPGAAVAAPSGWQPPRGYTGPRRTLLVLDDVVQNRDVIRDTLEPLGFTVRDAADTTAARAVLAAGGIDLVILDLRLPGEDGFAFARWLRATPRIARSHRRRSMRSPRRA
jgi:CheY-like chemotaxis protein